MAGSAQEIPFRDDPKTIKPYYSGMRLSMPPRLIFMDSFGYF